MQSKQECAYIYTLKLGATEGRGRGEAIVEDAMVAKCCFQQRDQYADGQEPISHLELSVDIWQFKIKNYNNMLMNKFTQANTIKKNNKKT